MNCEFILISLIIFIVLFIIYYFIIKKKKSILKQPNNNIIKQVIKEHFESLKTSDSNKTYSFYAWFGREQDEHSGKKAIGNPPYYILNNVNFADLDGELSFLYSEFFKDPAERKYGINILDKWLITYTQPTINSGCMSMQNNVIGPMSYNDKKSGGGWKCPGFIYNHQSNQFIGDGKWFYPEVNGNYNPTDPIFKSVPGWTPKYDPSDDTKTNCESEYTNLINTFKNTDGLGFQKQTQGYDGVWLSIIGDCPNLPQNDLNSDGKSLSTLSNYKIPTKCNGEYSYNCSDVNSQGSNKYCMEVQGKPWKSKLCVIDKALGTDDCQYKADYVGSIRLDDLGKVPHPIGNNGSTNDSCNKRVHSVLDKYGINYTTSVVGSDIDTAFWQLGHDTLTKEGKANLTKLRKILQSDDILCHQTDANTFLPGKNPTTIIPKDIYNIDNTTGKLSLNN